MGFIAYIIVFCAITFIEAVPWDCAQSTSLNSSPGWNPKPTLAPLVGAETALIGSNDLRRRQERGTVCGYINGQLGKNSLLFGWQFEVLYSA